MTCQTNIDLPVDSGLCPRITISRARQLRLGLRWISHMGHRHKKAVALLAILLACCGCASALDPSLDINQYAHTAWKVRDGFAKGIIYSIAQTPDGYVWLSTDVGLLRFDGVRAVPWQPPAGQHLPSAEVWRVLAARDGTLWIGTTERARQLEGRQAASISGAW